MYCFSRMLRPIHNKLDNASLTSQASSSSGLKAPTVRKQCCTEKRACNWSTYFYHCARRPLHQRTAVQATNKPVNGNAVRLKDIAH